MRMKRDGNIMTLDLHGAYADRAEFLLSSALDSLPDSVTELQVIHGSNRGTVIRDFVRDEFSHPRVKAKLVALNPGVTRLILK